MVKRPTKPSSVKKVNTSRKKSITAKELAENFKVSTRTIYRDVDVLSSVGVPVYMSKGNGGRIHFGENYTLSKALFF
ncbi:HTH domain-containing protein [Clostridium chromiireducens]|uniref:helix-turn-helix transcriptional regulator n=1 Tax=Clostridium chromiireducens TaxID=225345 RepID=UPI001A9A35F4